MIVKRFLSSGRIVSISLISAVFLGSCSAVPDEVNPVEWFSDTREATGGDARTDEQKKAEEEAKGETAPGSDQAFPNLGTTPPAPQPPSEEEREKAAAGLVADRENARYTDQVIRRQSSGGPPPPTPPAPPSPPPAQAASAAPEVSPPAPPAVPPPAPPSINATPPAPPSPPAPPTSTAARNLPAAPPPPVNLPPAAAQSVPRTAVPSVPAPAPRAIPPTPRVTPPPPPQMAAVPPRPPSLIPPRPTAPSGSRNLGQSSFGPPPTDIAIAQQAGVAPSIASSVPPSAPVTSGSTSVGPLAIPGAGSTRSLAEFDPNSVGVSTRVATIGFPNGSAKINGEGSRALREVARMARRSGATLRVVGHASSRTRDMDPVRHRIVNFSMSVDRANAVARALIGYGVRPDAIFVGAVSDAEPLYYEVMPAGEAGNRRTEVFLDSPS